MVAAKIFGLRKMFLVEGTVGTPTLPKREFGRTLD